jgi:hypothetical protein
MSSTLQSIFPDYPRDRPAIDKDGNLTSQWDLGLSALFQALQKNYKNEGLLIPTLDASNIAIIQSLYTPYVSGSYDALTANLPDISGQMVYDTTNNVPKIFVIVNTGGTVTSASWKTFTIT